MLRLKNIIAFFVLMLGVGAAVNAAVVNAVSDPGQPIVISKPHQSFKIRLASNPTTGYSWFIKSYDKNLVKAIKHHYQKPTQKMPGAGGYEEWTFKSTALFAHHAKTDIVFVYARPWEKNYVKTVKFTVQGVQ